ncbi:MAG: L-histidine N(alpha)-methyltransferase [Actinomycetota bacterium]
MIIEDPIVHDYLPEGYLRERLVADVVEGLKGEPRTLPPKWFYDERGSQLFDQITELPEYYPTRAERSILTARAAEIVDRSGADTLVELGSGSADKTRVLLDELMDRHERPTYVPFDVSPEYLRMSAIDLVKEYPGLRVEGIVGDLDLHLGKIPQGGRRLVAFLGGTVGNFDPAERSELFRELVAGFGDGDHLLLGTDLVKDPARLVAAYDDAAGVTAAFNKNVLRVLARQLDAELDPDGFDHVALWNDVDEWIEMRLRARTDQRIRIAELGLDVELAAGDDLRTEISAKFRLDRLGDELERLGLELVEVWTDPAGDYALSLSRRR